MRIDRRLGKFGRWAGLSGAEDADTHRAINDMLTQMKRDRQWDKLALVVNRIMSPIELYGAINRGDELPTGDESRHLERTAEHWLANCDLAAGTIADYKRVLSPLYGKCVRLGDLPAKLQRAKERALKSGKRRNFNICRSACLSLLLTIVDEEHKLYRTVKRVEELFVDVRPRNPQTVEQIRGLTAAMGENAEILWALCLTGMRRSEYWFRPWKAHPDRIWIPGAKGKRGSILPREVPKVYPVPRPRVGYSRFYHQLGDLTDGAVTPHDLRATYITWLEEVGVARIRRRIYLGHKVKDVTELYERKDVTRYLESDAEKLREYIGGPPAIGQGLKLA